MKLAGLRNNRCRNSQRMPTDNGYQELRFRTSNKLVAGVAAGIIAVLSTGAAPANDAVAYTQGPKNIFEGIYTQAQAQRGRELYGESCASCHGSKGGGGPAAPALTGSTFDYKAGSPLSDVVDFMIAAMPPEAPGKLRNKEYADILAYILELHGAPSGETELPYKIKELESFEIIQTPEDLPPPAPKTEVEAGAEAEANAPFNDGH